MSERVLQGAATSVDDAAVGVDSWPGALVALVAVLVAIVALYRDTALAMLAIWTRSDTFAHAFLVPPITLWLIWRLRADLARQTPRASPWSLAALAAVGLLWFFGELAAVNIIAQFALTSMLVAAVPAVLGWGVTRRIVFPLAFLFFAVPFGEFALPQLMEWTASFTILGLRLSGIPVYREGLQFVIPSGNWSVVEACSGVRYLIASFCIGTLYAYLTYRSARRRLLFVAVAIVVPLLANWLRAYMIVMIGHYSGNTLAVGVDHLVYGWVFFGVVIGLMFWIGSRWREDSAVEVAPSTAAVAASDRWVLLAAAGRPTYLAAAITAVIVAACWPFALWLIEQRLPPPLDQLDVLVAPAGWPDLVDRQTDWAPRYENPSAQLQASFGTPGRAVDVYLAYYRNQDNGRKLVSSTNVLVMSTDRRWSKVAGSARPINVGQHAIVVRRAELRSVDAQRLVAWQWYWVNGQLTASDFAAKAYTVLSRLSGQGDDSAVIVVYTQLSGDDDAALQGFVDAAWPQIDALLQRTRAQR